MQSIRAVVLIVLSAVALGFARSPTCKGIAAAEYQVAPFSVDVTIPPGHRCMAILPVKSKHVVDPLFAKGFVLLGAEKPIAFVAVDWCEIRNDSYDEWRDTIAKAAGTSRDHVLVSSVHQHNAPVVDRRAQRLLDAVGLERELYDETFHADCLSRLSDAVRKSLASPRSMTHLGISQAKVEHVASNRRVVDRNGSVRFSRNSGSGGDLAHAEAPEGEIDPFLKTLSFWNNEKPVVALHSYATHPMSYYGDGGVSADFVGLARKLHAADHPKVLQIYASGCSGDVTAGKYNDASPGMRQFLAERLYKAMQAAWTSTEKHAIGPVSLRSAPLKLPFREEHQFRSEELTSVLNDAKAPQADRILAAMTLSSRERLDRDQPIDFPCIDFGAAQVVLFPGEAFVAYQLKAQKMRPDRFVMCLGYGECWPGYIPTESAFDEGFVDQWLWVGRGSQERIEQALEQVLSKED